MTVLRGEKLILPDGSQTVAPKLTPGLWLWIEMLDGSKFEAMHRGLDILCFGLPTLCIERRPFRGTLTELRVQDIESITVLQANGAGARRGFGGRLWP